MTDYKPKNERSCPIYYFRKRELATRDNGETTPATPTQCSAFMIKFRILYNVAYIIRQQQ